MGSRNTLLRIATIDGIYLETLGRPITASALLDVQKHAEGLRELVVTPLPLEEVATMRRLLEGGMPQLEHLRICMVTSDASRQKTQLQAMVTFELTAAKFASLRSLVLDRACALLTPPLASHLLRLIMKNEHDVTQRLPLALFLDCISSFKCLEELELRNCFASFPNDNCHSRTQLLRSRLASVKIEDRPSNISLILSSMFIPVYADVRLVGDLRGVESTQKRFAGFSMMLPIDKRCLPILQRISHLDVYHLPEACYITGKTDSGNLLDLELITEAVDQPSLKPARGELFEMMVRNVRDLFPDSPVESLRLVGDVSYVPLTTWSTSLSRFRRLRELEVDDVDLRASPSDVIAALMTSYPTTLGDVPVCPALESLTLYGDIESLDVLAAILKCLEWRKEQRNNRSCMRLLCVSLYCDHDMTCPLLHHYQQELAKFADKTVVELIVVAGSRSR